MWASTLSSEKVCCCFGCQASLISCLAKNFDCDFDHQVVSFCWETGPGNERRGRAGTPISDEWGALAQFLPAGRTGDATWGGSMPMWMHGNLFWCGSGPAVDHVGSLNAKRPLSGVDLGPMLVTWWTGLCVMYNLDVQAGLSCWMHLGPMRIMWNLENAHGDPAWSGSGPHVDLFASLGRCCGPCLGRIWARCGQFSAKAHALQRICAPGRLIVLCRFGLQQGIWELQGWHGVLSTMVWGISVYFGPGHFSKLWSGAFQ